MIFILSALCLVAALTLCCIKHMHFFQLNSYKSAEHKVWIGRNKGPLLWLAILALLHLVALPMSTVFSAIVCTVISLLYAATSKPRSKKRSKKPLVYTARVIRMLITETLMFAITALIFFLLLPIDLYPIYAAAALLLCPHACMLANIINAPVEAAVRRYYLNDAVSLLRSHPSLKVVGITGSYGKTSTKYYLHTLLSEKYDVLMTPGSYNTPMGVVKTIRSSLRATHEIFICEMGAKYVGDIKELCEIVDPQLGLITSIGAQHLDTFGSLERIVKTKLELADYIKGKNGRVFINGDCRLLLDNAEGCTVCSSSETADYTTSNVRADEHGTSFTVTLKGGTEINLTAAVLGAHNVSNLALAAALAYEMGLSPDEIRRGARKIESAPHRLQLLHRGKDIIIDDAYNANPAGTKAALDALSLFDGYKIIVTPGMVELGKRSEEFNRELGVRAAKICDKIILVGKRQTESIYRGAIEAGYPKSSISVYEKVTDALSAAFAIASDSRKIILIENDLPDNY